MLKINNMKFVILTDEFKINTVLRDLNQETYLDEDFESVLVTYLDQNESIGNGNQLINFISIEDEVEKYLIVKPLNENYSNYLITVTVNGIKEVYTTNEIEAYVNEHRVVAPNKVYNMYKPYLLIKHNDTYIDVLSSLSGYDSEEQVISLTIERVK